MAKEGSEIKLVEKTSHLSTKAVILEKYDMALKRGWNRNIMFNHISSMTVEILGLCDSQI